MITTKNIMPGTAVLNPVVEINLGAFTISRIHVMKVVNVVNNWLTGRNRRR
ncbi:MAG: hypothetical protein HDS66_02295 [Bacteroidales bacterium]|nr:hypothetical protein [Bacteroidales bacterium]